MKVIEVKNAEIYELKITESDVALKYNNSLFNVIKSYVVVIQDLQVYKKSLEESKKKKGRGEAIANVNKVLFHLNGILKEFQNSSLFANVTEEDLAKFKLIYDNTAEFINKLKKNENDLSSTDGDSEQQRNPLED